MALFTGLKICRDTGVIFPLLVVFLYLLRYLFVHQCFGLCFYRYEWFRYTGCNGTLSLYHRLFVFCLTLGCCFVCVYLSLLIFFPFFFLSLISICDCAGEQGVIEGAFGKSGKFKARFLSGGQQERGTRGSLVLRFKKFMFRETKTITQ